MLAPRNLAIFVALAVILLVPFLLRPKNNLLAEADDTLVIITPNNEAIRQEFTEAFVKHYQAQTGRTVRIDWRTPGGTSEITRYLASEYLAAFEYYWRHTLGKPWNAIVQGSFDNGRIKLPVNSKEDTPEQTARRTFLESSVSCGIDLFFGGGSYDFNQHADAGRLVDSGVLARHPEWFQQMSRTLGGEPYWDAEGRWVGTCLSAFGICYNRDVLARLGLDHPPSEWSDLGKPVFEHEIAAADPTKSGSVAKSFEMLVQQQMQKSVAALGDAPTPEQKEAALAEGWTNGMQLIQRIGANARYFTDSASKIPLDVSLGDAAAGMCIDFYGRYQSESVTHPDGTSRMAYFTPSGGSSISVDPIGLLRGAPNRAVAEKFIDFVVSEAGQKLWNFKPGTPGGPRKYALRRLPFRKELYAPEFASFRSDPEVFPYEDAAKFVYHSEWTGPLLRSLSFAVRTMCLDSHDEMREAWKALIAAGFPPEATARFSDVSLVNYATVRGTIRENLSSKDRLKEVRLAKQLGDAFRAQYREVAKLAREGR